MSRFLAAVPGVRSAKSGKLRLHGKQGAFRFVKLLRGVLCPLLRRRAAFASCGQLSVKRSQREPVFLDVLGQRLELGAGCLFFLGVYLGSIYRSALFLR